MHRPNHHHLTQARTAGPEHPACAARQAQRAPCRQLGHPVPGLGAAGRMPPQISGGHLLQDPIACQRGRSS